MTHRITFFLVLFLCFSPVFSAQTEPLTFDTYHRPEDVNSILRSWNTQYPKLTKLISIGKSVEETDLLVLRIGANTNESPDPDSRPAVFVTANLEGFHLVGTEAALLLAEKLLTKQGSDEAITQLLSNITVYIAPLLNPDTTQEYFARVRYQRLRNSSIVDEDMDDRADEDGFDDLNRDGMITMMRVKDPEGKWIPDPSKPRLMRLADPNKGEIGLYKMYTEGLDNDEDGLYNEDPPGGIELNRNFPHDFEYFIKTAGLWPVSAPEVISLYKFLTAHPNIGMVLNFSTENTFLNLQQTGQAQAAADKFKVPEPYVTFLGLDPNTEYGMQELIDILKGMNIGGGIEINESLVAMLLGLGPAMSIDRQDLPIFQSIQKDYKDALKGAQLEHLEKRAKGVGKGSFVATCYYQLGVPVFSAHLWSVPEPKKEPNKDALTVEKLKSMSNEDFLALGEEKIAAFLKDQGAPPNVNAAMLIGMVESGQVTVERMAEMMEQMPQNTGAQGEDHPDSYILDWSDSFLMGNGFVDWTPYPHPTLGDVDIGGFIPYLEVNPPTADIHKTIDFHANYYIQMMGKLPHLEIKDTQVKALDEDLFQVTVYFSNSGWLPTSTAQGRRAQAVWPIRVELKTAENQNIFSGRTVVNIPFIGGSGDTQKVEWTIQGKNGSKVTVTAKSPRLNPVQTTIVLQ
ncbi:MAG: M14 family metallopeptidase [Candidatus Aminicenantes bacterium]|nr:M14 family metallopeptidase [Candidatus Aminicenantes bacterium]